MFSTPSLAQERNMDAAGPFPLWQWYKVISKNLTSPLLYWQRRRQTISMVCPKFAVETKRCCHWYLQYIHKCAESSKVRSNEQQMHGSSIA